MLYYYIITSLHYWSSVGESKDETARTAAAFTGARADELDQTARGVSKLHHACVV